MTNQKENNQSVDLSKYKLKNFDIDSIKNMIEEHKEKINNQENEIDINFDDDENLSLEEIKLYNDLKDTWNLINWLESVLIQTQKIQWKKNSDSWISKAYYKASNIFDETINRKNDISDKNIENYSPKEALEVLEFLNKTYTNYWEAISKTADELAENISSTDKLSHIDNDAEANIFQEKLIKIVLKKYPNKYIEWFDISDKKVWHYLIKIEDFEKNLKNLSAKDINSKALASYFIHLKNNWKFEKNTLIMNIWEKTLIELWKLWKNKKNDSEWQYAKQILKENWLDSIINEVVEINKEYLEIWLNWYNKIENVHYLFNKNEIKNISSKEKILELFKFKKENNINNDKKVKIEELVFNKDINPKLKADFDIIKKFNELQEKDLNLLDIKDLDYKSLKIEEITELFSMINEEAQITFIWIISIIDKEKLKLLIQNNNIWEKVSNIINMLKDNKYNKEWNEYNFEYDKLKSINNIWNNEKYNDLEINIIRFLNAELTKDKLQINKLDNYFSENINKNNEIIKLLSDDKRTALTSLLPKTIWVLISNPDLTKETIKNNTIIYTILPEKIKPDFSEQYIESLLKNIDKHDNIEREISKVRVKDIKQAKKIFSIIENNWNINIENILKYSEIRMTMLNIINEQSFTNQDKEFIEKFSILLLKFKKIFESYKDIYEKSKLKENIDKNKGSKVLSRIYNDDEFMTYLLKQKSNIQWPIVWIIRINNWEIREWERLDTYISMIAEEINTPEEFTKILDDITKIIDKALKEEKQEISNKELDEQELQINKKFIKEWKLDIDITLNNFEEFIINKKKEEGNNFESNKIEQYIEEFIINNNLNNLNNEKLNSLKNILRTSINSDKLKILINEVKENPNIFYAYKTWNSSEINKIWEEIDNKYYSNLENKITKLEEDNNKIETDKIENKNNNYYITNEESYNKVEWWYNLIWKNWETIEWLIISEEEKKLTMWNPEATENLVNFYEFFKELNLESIWDYRKELIISMWNRNINFIDNDSLSKSELIQFWNNLILSINNLISNKKEFENKSKLLITNSLSWVKNELRKFSWAWSILSDEKTYNIKWEDKFASTLRSFWIIWWAYFKINEFRKNIKW